MSERQCEKCGTTVAAAKAFCPECGNAFVDEEQREETSEFKMTDGTMQFSQTMYDQMLSDMGLNISKSSESLTKEVAPVLEQMQQAAPPPTSATPTKAPAPKTTTLKPAAAPAAAPAKKKTRMWLVIGGLVIILWLLVVILVIAFYLLQRRLT